MIANEITAKTPTADMRPEVELLLCCARTCIDSETAERIKTLLQEKIDWDYLIRTALSHGVMPLLYWSLNATCPEAVPKPQLAQLSDYFEINSQRHFFLTGELLKILNLLEAYGIPVISYKGPVIAASAYGNLTLTQFWDLDILIRKQDILRTNNLLVSQGYQLKLQLNWESRFAHDDSRAEVNLHWGITQRKRLVPFNFKRLWSRLEPISLIGQKVLNLQPEDLLLILCVQVTKDCGLGQKNLVKISNICDIAELLRVNQGIDWLSVMEQAGRLGSERMLFLGLFIANDLLGTALPDEVLQRMQAHPVVKQLAEQVRQRLFDTDGIFNVAMSPNSDDGAFLPLPANWFIYYLLRPIRIVKQYGLSLLKHCRANSP